MFEWVARMKYASLTLMLGIASGTLLSQFAFAQPKPGYDPSGTHIFPAGAKRGTKRKVLVGAECIPPQTRFTLFGKGVTAQKLLTKRIEAKGEPSPRRKPTILPMTIPREWESRIAIDKSAPLGMVRWRLSCAQGGTELRPFVIGDLPEFIETESNSTPESAEGVKLPVTVNGRIFGERDNDYFKFTANRGEVVVCEMLCHRLKSRLDPIIEILASDGRPVAVESIYVKNDPVLAFKADTAGEFLLRIANVSHHGDPAHVYRVNITKRRFVRSVFPTTGKAGEERVLAFRQMTGGNKPRIIRRRVRFPKEPGVFRYRLKVDDEAAGNVVMLRAIGHTVAGEAAHNDAMKAAQSLKLPITIDGRFATRSDRDWYAFDVQQGATYAIECDVPATGSAALPTLLLTDAGGKRLKLLRAVESKNRRCRLDWEAPASGRYYIRLRDQRFGAKAGPEFVYRLTVQRALPDYELAVDSEHLNLTQGNDVVVPVYVKRYGGFEEPISLKFEGLPEGVIARTQVLEGKLDRYDITIRAKENAPSQDARIRIVGIARALTKLVRPARPRSLATPPFPPLLRGGQGGSPEALAESIHLTVKHKPLFRLYCPEAYQYAHRGSVFMYPMTVERLNGFQGEVVIHEGDRQNRDMDGIEIGTLKVPPQTSDVKVPIDLPESMHINVQSQSQLYSQAYAIFKDEHGQQQSVLVLSEKRNMIRTLPPVVKLNAAKTTISATPGETVNIPLQLKRTTNFPGAMTVKLRDTEEATGFDCDDVTFKSGQSNATAVLHVPKTKGNEAVSLTLRGTGSMKDGTQIISETRVKIVPAK